MVYFSIPKPLQKLLLRLPLEFHLRGTLNHMESDFARMRSGSSETKLVQELILYATSAALSCLVLFVGLRHLDPNRNASKKALENKKEISKRLGWPLIQTNTYEVTFTCVVFLFTPRNHRITTPFCILLPQDKFGNLTT